MSKTQQIRDKINAQLVASLESGNTPPWRRPWCLGANAGFPSNVVSKKPYRGVNPLILDLASMRHGFSSKWWGTFNQWKAMGGMVKRRPADVSEGQWGSTGVFWSPVSKTVTAEDGTQEEDKFFVMKTFTVFNVDQVEGDHLDHLRAGHGETGGELPEIDVQGAEDIVTNAGMTVLYGGSQAFYRPSTDIIQMPPKSAFPTVASFAEVLFHEAVHATEHESRLNWSRKIKGNSYAMGELIAELGACYLSRELGIPAAEDRMDSHIAYLSNWLKAMKNDTSFIFTAAAQGSKAADFILSFSRTEEAVEEPLAALAC
jgi:antirestriction protein ArdC